MKKTISITIAVILFCVCFVTYKFYDVTNVEETQVSKVKQNNNLLGMLIETDAGSGKYEMTISSTWPTDGYVFNSELSKCENGGILTWDDTNKQVVFSGNVSDKCYVYFDVYVAPPYHETCNDNSLSCHIAKLYTGTQGENGIYYHDSSLTNGAEDNSYRYAGASADVNNYICLDSSEGTCPEDSLYRIIGVFGENNHGVKKQQLVKVIKNISYGSYKWNTTASNDWTNASLNAILNSTFKTEKLSGIENKIAEVSWKISGYSTGEVTAKTFYTAEISKATKTHTAKIGLMYPSDYGFATTQDYWVTNLYRYNSVAYRKDWLYLVEYEWTLSPSSSYSNLAWRVYDSGLVGIGGYVTDTSAVRPTFYLTSSVQYISGSGQESNPIRIN